VIRGGIVVCALALAAGAPGAAAGGGPSFAIGRTGGNIAPFTVTIAADGAVSATGPARFSRHRVSAATLAGLLAVADRQDFFTLPRLIRCRKTLPDFASQLVTVKTAAGTRTVVRHGGCSARFNAVYRALATAVGLK
jgi:hypothetical protein